MTDRRYGRRPPKGAPALRFAAVRDAVTLAYPPTSDSTADLSDWQMLWNDSWGDCVVVTWASIRRIITSLYATEHYTVDEASILGLYRTQNPGFDPNSAAHGPGSDDDGGMDIQTLLELLVKQGGPDGVKALAFAKVDHSNIDEMKAALAIFKTVWLGVVVTGDDEQEFPDRPWTRTGQALGGHSIVATGYTPHRFLMQTWADEGELSDSFVLEGDQSAGVEEAWVVIWPEHGAHLTSAQKQALDDQFHALTGKHIAWPADPTPGPAPTPVPTPDPTPADVPEEILQWLQSVPRYYRHTWQALKDWLGL